MPLKTIRTSEFLYDMLFDYRWLSNQYNFLHSYSCWFFLCARLSFYSAPKELVLSRCTYQQLLEMSIWTKQVNHVLSISILLQSLIKYLLTDWISIKIDSVRSPAICNPLLYPATTCNENPKFEMISAWQALEALYIQDALLRLLRRCPFSAWQLLCFT